MSRIALQYGATIDKYVGDAIVLFFGDPTTLGVKADALACVQMAIAMQKRVSELADKWSNSGIEMPLRCRIGIHTGYCTVGNFGSEDRMDYTMVGGTVNLASRLEREADFWHFSEVTANLMRSVLEGKADLSTSPADFRLTPSGHRSDACSYSQPRGFMQSCC